MLRTVALLALCGPLLACSRIQAVEWPPGELEAAEAAWVEHGLPRPHCADDIELAIVGDAKIRNFCRRCPPGQCPGGGANAACPYGCTAGCPIYRHNRWVAVVHHDHPTGRWHELQHILSGCTFGTQDPQHADKTVWQVILRQLGGV